MPATTLQFVLDNWYLFVTALVSGGLLLWPTISGGVGGGRVSAADAVRMRAMVRRQRPSDRGGTLKSAALSKAFGFPT